MDFVNSVIGWVTAHYAVLVTVLFLLSEALAQIPQVEASSVFQLIANAVKGLHDKLSPPAA